MSSKCESSKGNAVAGQLGRIYNDLVSEGFDREQAFTLSQEFARNHRYDPDTMRWAQGGGK